MVDTKEEYKGLFVKASTHKIVRTKALALDMTIDEFISSLLK